MTNRKFQELVVKTLHAQQEVLEELAGPFRTVGWGTLPHPANEKVKQARSLLSSLETYIKISSLER